MHFHNFVIFIKLKEKLITEIDGKLAKNNNSTILKFVGTMLTLIATVIVGILKFSTLDALFTGILVGGFSLLFIFILCFTLIKSISNPAPFILEQNAYLIYLREKLGDSNSSQVYFADSESIVNSNNKLAIDDEKIDLIEPVVGTNKITTSK